MKQGIRYEFDLLSAMPIQVGVRAGIYHGGEALCDIKSTRAESGSNPTWNQFLDFDLKVADIPRMARLCLVIYGVTNNPQKKSKKKKEVQYYIGISTQRALFNCMSQEISSIS